MIYILLAFSTISLVAQLPAPTSSPTAPKAEDPLDRLNPRSSVIGFLNAVRDRHDDTAAQFLNLGKMPLDEQRNRGADLARRLGRALDRDSAFDVAQLSNEADGNRTDGLPPDRDRLASFQIGNSPIELQRLSSRTSTEPSVWVISAESVALIPKLEQQFDEPAVEKHLPAPLVEWTLWGTSLWRLIALSLLIAVVWAASRTLSQLVLLVVRPVCNRVAPGTDCGLFELILHPLRLLVSVAIFRAGLVIVTPSALMRFYIGRVLELLTVIGFAWLLSGLVDVIITRLRAALKTRHATLSQSVLPLVSRILKAFLLVLAITAVLANWGFDMTAILAGVGIGGIAVALAAQKTIENLFGGVAIITDGPVIVGDFCKFGDRVGTVEDIGLRSTRVRTLDRTLVTIPNSEFSSMTLENFSRRDKIWFHPTLNLRRDTTPDQMRQIIDAIRNILTTHPKVETGDIPVRFVGTGLYSLDVETFAYILTANFDEYLRIQEDLLLHIMNAIATAGAGLALPTQASINYTGVDQAMSLAGSAAR